MRLRIVLLVLAVLPWSDGAAQQTHRVSWPDGVDRVWIGPEHWANRLQDWRLQRGRVECVEARDRFPLRTLHLLTRSVASGDALVIAVRTGPLEPSGTDGTRGWRGVLFGAGGPHVDYRLTALVHHRPAEDGGLLAVVDDQGRVALRDNAVAETAGGQWSIAGPLREGDAPERRAAERLGPEPDADRTGAIDLTVRVEPRNGRAAVTVTAHDASGRRLSRARYTGLEPNHIDGGLALVSHLGPPDAEAGYWFDDWRIEGPGVRHHPDRILGPVLALQYTVSGGILKCTAQFPPLGATDPAVATLQVRRGGDTWIDAARAHIVPDSWTATFRVEQWDATRAADLRVAYELATGGGRTTRQVYEGRVPEEPVAQPAFVVASLNCHKIYTGGLRWNHDGLWFPHAELVDAVATHDPDLLFFAGDQIYEGDLDPAQTRPEDVAILDYLYKWFRWCWAFGELTRRTPTVTIPDDHDVYHGNIWGAGGKRARATEGITAQDSGGYKMSPRFVNAVHRTQTSHLPDPAGPGLIGEGYSVYYTSLVWGGVSCAILADRQFKSSPTVAVPEGRVVNGWFQNPDFDPATQADVAGAELLGPRQQRFLERWAVDWSDGAWMKLVLSQTIFANVATLPEDARSGSVLPSLPHLPPDVFPDTYRLAADADSNGWPPSRRNDAVRAMRRGFALHLAGDQHLGSLIEYGVDGWRDGSVAFCAPAIANTWPRRWYPPVPGRHREPGAPPYTGDFLDGFGNHVTVYAVANPVRSGREPARLYDRAPGYGIVRLERATRRFTIECWPRWADPSDPAARQYVGWPRTFEQTANGGRPVVGRLPSIEVHGVAEPVVRLVDEQRGVIESARRWPSSRVDAEVYGDGPYTVEIGEPGTPRWRTLRGLRPSPAPTWTLQVRLGPS